MSLPSIISMVTISLYNLVNTFWVSRLGYEAVAAVTVVMPFFIMCIALGAGTGVGVNAIASRRFGERDTESANRVAGQTLFLSLALGLAFFLITNLLPRQVLLLSGAPPDVLPYGEAYVRMLGWGMPMLFFSMIARNVFQASGDAIRPMVFAIIAQAVNVALDPALIFGWGPFPEMGIAGAGLATAIASGVSASLAIWQIMSNRTSYRIRGRHCTPHLPTILGIYRVGLPAAVMEMTEGVVFALFNHVIASFGSVALAAVGIAGRIADLAFMPVVGTAHGLLPIIGFSLGARMWSRLWKAVRLASVATALMMALATVALEVFTLQLVRLFTRDAELISIAVPGMRIFLSTMVLIGPTIMFITTFQGLSRGRDALVLSLARQFIFFVPALYGLTHLMGITGVWVAMPISDFVGSIASGLWLFREYRRQRKDPAWGSPLAGSQPPDFETADA